jgi:hypothetical protein
VKALRYSRRRGLNFSGAAIVGVAAAVAFASPAEAHVPVMAGTAVCDTAAGDWKVTWRVENSETEWTGEIKDVDGVLTGEQRVPASKTSARLELKVFWDKELPEADVTDADDDKRLLQKRHRPARYANDRGVSGRDLGAVPRH